MENIELFKEICDQAMMAIAVFDKAKGSGLYANQLAIETLEMKADEKFQTFQLEKLYTSTERPPYRNFNSEMIQFSGFYQDVLMRKSSGRDFIANAGVRIIHNDQYLVVMFQDVTFQKKLQREITVKQQALNQTLEEIMGQNEELKSLDAAKDKFITLSTHELRTPLSGIIASSESLKMGLLEAEQIPEFAGSIYNEANHLMKIVNNILDLMKLNTGKMPLYVDQLNLSESIQESLALISPIAEKKQIEVSFSAPEEEITCYFDKSRVKQILQNLLENAVKFSPEKTKIEVKTLKEDEKIFVQILDEGPGIDSQQAKSLFQEFEVAADIQNHKSGSGLGLPIAKKLMLIMGGDLELIPQQDKGSCFQLWIPTQKVLSEDMYGSDPELDVMDLLDSI